MTGWIKFWATTACAVTLSLTLAACGGGGGGGPGGGVTTPAPPSPPPSNPPPAPPPANTPSTTSDEFLRNYAVGAIKADKAWAQGATGKGVVIGVIDTGIDFAQPDLQGNISSDSTDVIAGRQSSALASRHGTRVAGVAAAAFNGMGTIGVAYQSTILSVRAETDGSCATECSFNDVNTARGIDYAVAHGARVINLSLGGPDPSSAAFIAAMQRAVGAGVVFAISAGNDSAANPSNPAMLAVDPRFQGSVIAVGATTQAGTLASFSNKAGAAAQDYITAPGVNIVSDCDASGCWSMSGTSFSAPQVAGALALLLQAFPNLTGAQAADILLRTADDLGDPGTDAVYGRGGLNLQRAFQPVGTTSVPTAAGAAIALPEGKGGGTMGAAFGGAVRVGAGLTTIGYDDYRRLFVVDLGAVFHGAARQSLRPGPASSVVSSSTIQTAGGARLSLTVSRPAFADAAPAALTSLTQAQPQPEMLASFRQGALLLDAWRGQPGAAPGFEAAPTDAFTLMAGADHAVRAGYALGPWTLSAEEGGGPRRAFLDPTIAPTDQGGSRYVRATAGFARGPWRAAASFGTLTEDDGPLGSLLSARAGFQMPARTQFATLSGDWDAADGVTLSAEASMGRSQADGRVLQLAAGALSSSWRVGARADCALLNLGCTGLSLDLSQPVRVERGAFTARLADVPAGYFDPVTFSDRRVDAAPTARELDLGLNAWRDLDAWGVVQLRGVVLFNENHDAANAPNLGLFATWRASF
ncbi:S8 family peptidase [Caulobacter sp. CCUG 60055]|uniref:S8 family peptidase n=2 Tax=Pseudomonadota TaxID=1224 RepID=UPI001FA76A62|nr:S8 family peptidase [Caulobacter sp. CCUG 60055]